jgi:hypothetical protein
MAKSAEDESGNLPRSTDELGNGIFRVALRTRLPPHCGDNWADDFDAVIFGKISDTIDDWAKGRDDKRYTQT